MGLVKQATHKAKSGTQFLPGLQNQEVKESLDNLLISRPMLKINGRMRIELRDGMLA